MMAKKRMLCVVLAMMLATVPVCAMASGAEGIGHAATGSYTLLLSDPVISTVSGGQTATQDLTGLSLQFGTVGDFDNLLDLDLMHSLMVLVKNEPAITAMYGYKAGELYALVNGVSHLLVVPIEEVMNMAEKQMEAAGVTEGDIQQKVEEEVSMLADAAQVLENIQFAEGPAEDVEFYNGVGHCTRHSASLSNDDLKALLNDVQALPKDMSLDVSYFMDDKGNVRVEGVAHDVTEDDAVQNRDVAFVVVAEFVSEDAANMGGYVGNGDVEVNFDFNAAKDAVHKDHETVEGVVDLQLTKENAHYQLQISLNPGEAEDGAVADVFNATLFEGEEAMGALNFVTSRGDAQESFSVYLGNATGTNAVSATYDGTVKQEGTEKDRKGKFTVEYADDQTYVRTEMGVYVNHSTSIEGKILDTSGMQKLDVVNMTEKQSEQLMTELQQAVITAAGKLMTLPPVAGMISGILQSGALTF